MRSRVNKHVSPPYIRTRYEHELQQNKLILGMHGQWPPSRLRNAKLSSITPQSPPSTPPPKVKYLRNPKHLRSTVQTDIKVTLRPPQYSRSTSTHDNKAEADTFTSTRCYCYYCCCCYCFHVFFSLCMY